MQQRLAEQVLGVVADLQELRLGAVEDVGHGEVGVQLSHLADDVHLIALVGRGIEGIGTGCQGLLNHHREVLGALCELLEHHDLDAELLGTLPHAFRGPCREWFVEVDHGQLLNSDRPHEVGARLAKARGGDLGRGDDVLVALLVNVVAGGRPDHQELAELLGGVGCGAGQGRSEGAE